MLYGKEVGTSVRMNGLDRRPTLAADGLYAPYLYIIGALVHAPIMRNTARVPFPLSFDVDYGINCNTL